MDDGTGRCVAYLFSHFLLLSSPIASSCRAFDAHLSDFHSIGKLLPTYFPVCDVSANLESLVALSTVHGERGNEFVHLEVEVCRFFPL
jgi:hypothetical protein